MAKKELRISVKLSLNAKTPKTLFSHLSVQLNLIQHFRIWDFQIS